MTTKKYRVTGTFMASVTAEMRGTSEEDAVIRLGERIAARITEMGTVQDVSPLNCDEDHPAEDWFNEGWESWEV